MPDMLTTADIVICGAGIAGIAAAYELAVRRGIRDVLLVDERDPLSLTSDKSSECYRDWWPDPAMARLMSRSIDLLDELALQCDNRFQMNRRGYLYATADPARVAAWRQLGASMAAQGVGEFRIHSGAAGAPAYVPAEAHGFTHAPRGADLMTDPELLRCMFPYLADDVVGVLHARRCGWLSAQQLGMYLLEEARAAGVRLVRARVTAVEQSHGRVSAVRLAGEAVPQRVATGRFINAAGPLAAQVAGMLGVQLPIFSERHAKAALWDTLGIVPRDAPMLIWADPQRLDWAEDEREMLDETPETRALLGELPPGAHTRPEGRADSTMILALWAYDAHPVEEIFPPPFPDEFFEVTLRGLMRMLPGMARYLERPPRPVIDGGYYTRTRENRPLIGPLPIAGAYILCAFSGFGVMAACAAAELLADYLTGASLSADAPAFHPERYADPAYLAQIAQWDDGQL